MTTRPGASIRGGNIHVQGARVPTTESSQITTTEHLDDCRSFNSAP
ncbi:hypothetical protein JMJ78_0000894, partial [Colletotrichum scovillei]